MSGYQYDYYEENSVNKEEDNYSNPNNQSFNQPVTFKDNSKYKYNSNLSPNPNCKVNSLSSSPINDIKTIETMNFPGAESSSRTRSNKDADQFYYSEEDNKMRLQLMEKDKIIFEYSKALKETERVLDHTKKLVSAKEEIIVKLKDETKDLKFRIKNEGNLLKHKEQEFEKYKNHSEEKILFMNKEKSVLGDKLNEMTTLFERNQSDFQNTLIEYKKIEKQLTKLKQNFAEKNEVLSNYEKTIESVKKENKIIPTFKKQISDLENSVNDLKSDVQNEKLKSAKILSEREEIERRFREFIAENQVDKENANKSIKQTYEIESLKKEYEEKSRESNTLNEKYKSLVKDNDNFVQMITNEIGQFTNLLENISNHKGIVKASLSAMSNLPYKNLNCQFSLKYELINKNFEILKNKIIENYNNSITLISKLERNINEVEKYNREINNEKDSLLKELSVNKQNLNETCEIKEELQTKLIKLNEDHKNLKQNYVKVKTENEDITKRNESVCSEIQLFLSNCFNKLREKFPEMCSDNEVCNSRNFDMNYSEKILYYLDILVNEYSKLVSNEREVMEGIKMTQIQLKNAEDEKDLFKARIERILLNKEEDLKQADALKSEELKRQREVLYEKISSLTSLLEESNTLINLYENENRVLKEKSSKMEFNLKMLTNSHLELENSIAGNYTSLQTENDEKEMKYNQLLRELELKSIHIESIENLLRRKEDELDKLSNEVLFQRKSQDEQFRSTFGSKQNNIVETEERNTIQNTSFRSKPNFGSTINMDSIEQPLAYSKNVASTNVMSNSYSSFVPNEENENELKKLINTYNPDEEDNNTNNSNVRYGIISSVNKPQRIPGKIYSLKKLI